MYGLLILSILTNLFYVLGLPLALFRLYILVAALVSLLCCLRWAAASRRLRETRLYAWGLRLAAVLLAAVLFAELWGKPSWPSFSSVSLLRTLALVLVLVCSGISCAGAWSGLRAARCRATLLCWVATPRWWCSAWPGWVTSSSGS